MTPSSGIGKSVTQTECQLGWEILHRLTGEKPVKMFHCFTDETSVQIYLQNG